jgi:hypothetical protein
LAMTTGRRPACIYAVKQMSLTRIERILWK